MIQTAPKCEQETLAIEKLNIFLECCNPQSNLYIDDFKSVNPGIQTSAQLQAYAQSLIDIIANIKKNGLQKTLIQLKQEIEFQPRECVIGSGTQENSCGYWFGLADCYLLLSDYPFRDISDTCPVTTTSAFVSLVSQKL